MWTVYIIQTDSGRLYTGITTNLRRRFKAHASAKGAKFFRLSKPERILYQEKHPDRSAATKREIAIKKLSRKEKFALIKNHKGHKGHKEASPRRKSVALKI